MAAGSLLFLVSSSFLRRTPIRGARMRMPLEPFLILRPSWFHAYMRGWRWASAVRSRGCCRASSCETGHSREVVGEGFRVSRLKLLNEQLHVGLNDLAGALRLWEEGRAVTLLGVAALFMVALLSLVWLLAKGD